MIDEATEQNAKLAAYVSGFVAAYVSNNRVHRSELPTLIELVAQSLQALVDQRLPDTTRMADKPSEREIEKSIQRDRLISFVDGKGYKALRRHLRFNGHTPQSYRARYGLPVDYPMVAPSYSERRSEISREINERKNRPAQGEMIH